MKYFLPVLISLTCLTVSAQNRSEIANLKSGDYPDHAQSVIGFWVVNSVDVGDKNFTPTAKWFEFMDDGTQVSGNGWVQNGLGGWHYDAAASQLLTTDQAGNEDEYGPFTIEIRGDKMTWNRSEDGMKVIVQLERAIEKPLAPWDKIVGRWTLVGLESWEEGSNIRSTADLDTRYSYLFRWDRRYVKRDANGKRIGTGIWHIESHDPWLWLIPDDGSPKQGQQINFDKKGSLTFQSKQANTNEKLIFSRE